jgi:adenosylcobinamide-GDP ribazoletransferase
MKRFLAAVRFLTVVPIPGSWGTSEEDLAGSVPYFPLVGVLLSVISAAVAWAISLYAPPMLSAMAIVVVLMAFSGCLHLDGLSDTADGVLSSRPRERMLEIMRDSHTGAMGVIAIVCIVLAKFAATASIPTDLLWRVALLMPLAGRAAIVLHMAMLPYVRPEGLGKVFCHRRPSWSAVVSLALLAATAWLVLGTRGLVAAAASVVGALAVAIYIYRKLGGATGDTFGAVCELVEAVPAIVIACMPVEAGR